MSQHYILHLCILITEKEIWLLIRNESGQNYLSVSKIRDLKECVLQIALNEAVWLCTTAMIYHCSALHIPERESPLASTCTKTPNTK